MRRHFREREVWMKRPNEWQIQLLKVPTGGVACFSPLTTNCVFSLRYCQTFSEASYQCLDWFPPLQAAIGFTSFQEAMKINLQKLANPSEWTFSGLCFTLSSCGSVVESGDHFEEHTLLVCSRTVLTFKVWEMAWKTQNDDDSGCFVHWRGCSLAANSQILGVGVSLNAQEENEHMGHFLFLYSSNQKFLRSNLLRLCKGITSVILHSH